MEDRDASQALATKRAYRSDWEIFTNWCDQHETEVLPASAKAVAAFALAEAKAGINPNTIARRVTAISYYHRQAGHIPPNAGAGAKYLLEALAAIRATCGKPKEKKAPAVASVVRDMIEVIDGTGLRAARDRAILAIGMSAALRRSELAAFDVEDIQLATGYLVLRIRSSGTDQVREDRKVIVPEGIVIKSKALLLDWMAQAGHHTGPLFRRLTRRDELREERMSDKAVARLVQHYAAAAGYDPSKFGGHSLRSGFLTEAANHGATIATMEAISRHKSLQALSDCVQTTVGDFENHPGDSFL